MRRVVITGLGIVSSIGNDAAAVAASLKAGRSGISFAPEYAEHGFRCHVHGRPEIDVAEHIDKRQLRFMGDGAAFAYLAMQQAIADAGLEPGDVSNERTGLIADLTSTMLSAALRQVRTWQDEGLILTCAVNLPPGLVTDLSFPDRVAASLAENVVDGKRLVLELTETATIQNPTATMSILTRLRVKGIGL